MAKTIVKGALAARRMSRGALQARIRPARRRSDRPGRAPPPGRGLVRPFRGEHPQMAQIDDRHVGLERRAAADLRRRRHVADSAAAAAVWPGRGRVDRRSLETATGGQDNPRPATATALPPMPPPPRTCSGTRDEFRHREDNPTTTDTLTQFSYKHERSQRQRPRTTFIRGSRPSPGCAGAAELLGAASRRARAGHERHQRSAADRRAGRDDRRRKGRARGLGLQLPGRGLRGLHDGHQRPRAAGLLGLGRSAAGRESGGNRAAADDEVSRRSRSGRRSRTDVRGAQKAERWIPVDGYYDMGPGPRVSPQSSRKPTR